MAHKAEVWIKGTLVQFEQPVQNMVKRGWGSHFLATPMKNWFHFAITTPVMIDEARSELVRISVFYRAENTVIRSIHLYDGLKLARHFDDLEFTGDHSENKDDSNSWTIHPPMEISFGLGVSLGVEFLPEWGEILFNSIGAEFVFSGNEIGI